MSSIQRRTCSGRVARSKVRVELALCRLPEVVVEGTVGPLLRAVVDRRAMGVDERLDERRVEQILGLEGEVPCLGREHLGVGDDLLAFWNLNFSPQSSLTVSVPALVVVDDDEDRHVGGCAVR